MRSARVLLFAVTLVFALLAGWRVFALMRAEQLARIDPERALRQNPGEPEALWGRTNTMLDAGDAAGAASAARALLAQEPLQGRAFVTLAEIAARGGHADEALRLYGIAVHRASRDPQAINGLVQMELQREDYVDAMHWIDFYLRTSTGRAATSSRVLPGLVPLALDGKFASALVGVLRQDPPWRGDMMAALRINPTAAARVYGQLEREHALRPDEYFGWIDGLVNAGQWDEAHMRWVAKMQGGRPGGAQPYNGDFSSDPSNHGFDWRLPTGAAMSTEFEPVAGTRRRILHLHFFDQTINAPLLEHALRLSVGDHILQMRIRTRSLSSAEGVAFQVACPNGTVIGAGDPLIGSADWQTAEIIVRVPPSGCPGQWLRLNQVWSGTGARLSGDLWVDDVRVEAMASN